MGAHPAISPVEAATPRELAARLVNEGLVPHVGWRVVTRDRCGPLELAGDLPADGEPIFLTASLTKPIVAMAALRLVEQGRLALCDRVGDLLPEFAAASRRSMTVRHLLTHTSGLPDMLPDNRQLRQQNAPLAAFVEGTCHVTLDFPPGRGVQYQSMGYVLLGEIIARVTGRTCAEFLAGEFFEPLGMEDTALGAPESWFEAGGRAERLLPVRVPEEQAGGDDWNWNSRYWRTLGAPWGGLLSTVSDLARFLQCLLNGGELDGVRILSESTVNAATQNQLTVYRDLPEAEIRTRGWGFGWRLNWAGHTAPLSELASPETFGHWGATGTLWWIDPVRQCGCVILSTQPLAKERSHLVRLSNAIYAHWK